MRRRASTLIERARERIRLAAERDHHHWAALGAPQTAHPPADGGTYTVHAPDGEPPRPAEQSPGAGARAAPVPPLGSPEPGAPDVDNAPSVSGPPPGRTAADGGAGRRQAAGWPTGEASVPAGLRTAASWSWRIILVGVALYLALRLIGMLLEVFVPLLIALLLAALLQPAARGLARRGWPRSLAALTMLLAGLLVVAGIVTLVVNRVTADWSNLTGKVSKGITQIGDFLVRTFPITHSQLDQLVSQTQHAIGSNRGAIASGAVSTAGTVTQVFTGVLLTLLTLFFFLKDGRSIWLWIVGLCPRSGQAYLDEAGRRSWRTLVSYVRATVTVALIDAIGIGIGLVFLRVPLALPLAALVFIGAFIPIIGSFIAGSVAVIVALVSNGFVTALITLGVVLLVMQLEGHIFSPLLLGRAVRIHPLAVVLGIATGLIVGGIFGALIAVPIIACLNVGGSYLVHRHEGPRPPDPYPGHAQPVVGTT